MTSILEDNLNDELKTDDTRIQLQQVFDFVVGSSINRQRSRDPRVRSAGKAKSLNEFYALVNDAINDYQDRASVPKEERIIFSEEDADIDAVTETITFSLTKREPGAFGQGPPFESKVRNLKPILREEGTDSEEPGYRKIVNGYWYDNIVRFTCWANTNKRANYRAMWFEDLMEEYSWWFKLQGVDRVIFWGRQADVVVERDNNKWYGRPLDFFVRTEKLRVFREKTLEEILIKLAVKPK